MLRSTFLFALAFLFVLLGAASSASAQADSDISNCKNPHVENLTGIRFPMKNDQGIEEMRMILTGAPDRPVRIDCEDMHLSADQMEVFDNHRVVATGNVLFESQSNRIASERLEFDTKTRTGTFYNASGTVSMANRVDRSMFGTQEPDAMFRGDEVHKLGPDTYKIVTRRVYDLRSADASLGDGWRIGDVEGPRPRFSDQLDPAGQGRARDVSAGLLLPCAGRRSGDRLSDPDLWSLHRPRAVAQQRLLLGDRPQPGRDVPARLVTRRPVRRSGANTGTSSGAATTATPNSTC